MAGGGSLNGKVALVRPALTPSVKPITYYGFLRISDGHPASSAGVFWRESLLCCIRRPGSPKFPEDRRYLQSDVRPRQCRMYRCGKVGPFNVGVDLSSDLGCDRRDDVFFVLFLARILFISMYNFPALKGSEHVSAVNCARIIVVGSELLERRDSRFVDVVRAHCVWLDRGRVGGCFL